MGDVHSIEERRGVERGSEEGRSVKEQIQSLLLAAERGDVRGVRQLLEEGFDPNLQNGVGWTAMMHAAYKGELALARLLLEKGADPDRQSVSGWTALMSAACEGNREMVALLLENGAEPSVQDGAGRTALDLAVRHGRSDIADTLRKAMGVQSGFTLLELSMVLVIIGLIIGGITVGANLIRAGQLQSVTKDVERFQQAILDFRDKYQSLPGDMPNAESFWGSDSSCPADSPLVPKTATCNGTGIGTIGGCESGTTCANPTAWYEWFRAWQQLADAGMIDGAFTGVSLGGSGNIRAWLGSNQSNVPASKIKGGGYTLRYFKDSAGDVNYYPGPYGHIIHFGMIIDTPPSWTYNPVITPAEALAMDIKIDDGLPAYGKMMGVPPTSSVAPNCTTSSTPSAAQYNTAYTANGCAPIFILPF